MSLQLFHKPASMIGCFFFFFFFFFFGGGGLKRPFETVFQFISGRLSERGSKKIEMIDERKNVQTTSTRTYCKHSRPLPYYNPNCRTPRHWKFIQDHRTTRTPPLNVKMPTVSGILTFTNGKNSILCLSEPKKANFLIFYTYEHHARLSWA